LNGPLCALAFKNVYLQSLYVQGPALKFFPTSSQVDMSGTIINKQALSTMAIEQLDATILHPQVFSSITSFYINNCLIRRIQTDLFKNMHSFQFINFNLYNLKGFVHGNGIEWMRYLGSNQTVPH
jgi:hypothetical protein